MDFAAFVVLQLLTGIATLMLIGAGLAVIFGMMRVINLAHGEFLMLGGYAAILAEASGVNLWVAMLVVAPVAVGAIGFAVERLLIRRFYGRLVDTLLATWGLSLLLTGAAAMIFGNTMRGISAPLGSFAVGGFRAGAWDLMLIGAAAAIMTGIHLVLYRTRAGLRARAVMRNPDMAAALGIDRARVHAATFTAGAALSGLAGALLTPVSGVAPTIGAAWVAKAFVTVMVGGAAIVPGTAASATLLGGVGTGVGFAATPVLGEVALFAAAVVLVRLLPRGITGRFFRAGV